MKDESQMNDAKHADGRSELSVELERDLAISERNDVIRAAARLAGALKDIFNDLGNMPEVRARFDAVYLDVSSYAGQEERGL